MFVWKYFQIVLTDPSEEEKRTCQILKYPGYIRKNETVVVEPNSQFIMVPRDVKPAAVNGRYIAGKAYVLRKNIYGQYAVLYKLRKDCELKSQMMYGLTMNVKVLSPFVLEIPAQSKIQLPSGMYRDLITPVMCEIETSELDMSTEGEVLKEISGFSQFFGDFIIKAQTPQGWTYVNNGYRANVAFKGVCLNDLWKSGIFSYQKLYEKDEYYAFCVRGEGDIEEPTFDEILRSDRNNTGHNDSPLTSV